MPLEATYTAADRKRGMTLGELMKVVQQALRDDVPLETPLGAEVGFRLQLQKITIKS